MIGRLIMRSHYLNQAGGTDCPLDGDRALLIKKKEHGYEGHSLYFYSFAYFENPFNAYTRCFM